MHEAPDPQDRCEGTTKCKSNVKRRRLLRWALRIVLVLVVLIWVIVGPWPANNATFVDSDYEQRTLARLASTKPLAARGTILVGLAERDITPAIGHPLAGMGKRAKGGYERIGSRCRAMAMTVQCADVSVTILSADLLFIGRELAAAVLKQSGVDAGQVYFTSTHTHSGPGAYERHLIAQPIMGRFEQCYFDELATALANCVTASRRNLVSAEMAAVTLNVPGRRRNRIDESLAPHDQLAALVFRESAPGAGQVLAILAVFGAHATIAAADEKLLSADYPGAFARALRDRTGARLVMFAAGAVGDATAYRPNASTATQRADLFGLMLADDLAPALAAASYQPQIDLASLRLSVELPPLRVPLSAGWRLSPIGTSWISDSKAHLHIVKIGPNVLVGFPGDYAGHLARDLTQWAAERDLTLVPTSFNGDYKGYLVSQPIFIHQHCYETRAMNFFGPWCGQYLTEVSKRAIERMQAVASVRSTQP